MQPNIFCFCLYKCIPPLRISSQFIILSSYTSCRLSSKHNKYEALYDSNYLRFGNLRRFNNCWWTSWISRDMVHAASQIRQPVSRLAHYSSFQTRKQMIPSRSQYLSPRSLEFERTHLLHLVLEIPRIWCSELVDVICRYLDIVHNGASVAAVNLKKHNWTPTLVVCSNTQAGKPLRRVCCFWERSQQV